MTDYDRTYRIVFAVFATAVAVFVILNLSVPYMNAYGTLRNLDGAAGVLDHSNIWKGLDALSCAFYTIGDYGCHQEMARSIILNGNQVPLCIRCTFLFIGIGAGFAYFAISSTMPLGTDKKALILGITLVLLTPLEWSMEHYLELGGPVIRSIVSLISGFGAIVAVVSLLHFEENILLELKKKKYSNTKK